MRKIRKPDYRSRRRGGVGGGEAAHLGGEVALNGGVAAGVDDLRERGAALSGRCEAEGAAAAESREMLLQAAQRTSRPLTPVMVLA